MEALPNIVVMKQPEWISDDEIAEVLHDAHRTTLAAGMHYTVLNQNGEDIRKRLGTDGCFFVALLDGKDLVGVSGVSFYEKSNAWYAKGKPYAEVKLEGVKNAYKGMGINGMLHRNIYNFAFTRVDVLITHTALQNRLVIRNDLNREWKKVDFTSWRTTDYYSVIMAKWKNGCPYSRLYCTIRYYIKKAYTCFRYKPGRIKRFYI